MSTTEYKWSSRKCKVDLGNITVRIPTGSVLVGPPIFVDETDKSEAYVEFWERW